MFLHLKEFSFLVFVEQPELTIHLCAPNQVILLCFLLGFNGSLLIFQVSTIQSCPRGINKVVDSLQQKLPDISKTLLRNKVREISDFVDNRWQVCLNVWTAKAKMYAI